MARSARICLSVLFGSLLLPSLSASATAQNARFDLTGPKVDVRVTRGSSSLPIAMVPNLLEGDELWLHADLPTTQSAKYLLVVAFLRGTTNPPPENWIIRFETWERHIRAEGAHVTVPPGAQQAVLLLAPETGGDLSTLRSAIRGRPGIFVRASQDLAEAGFEQARIEKYLSEIRKVPPGDSKALAEHSEFLARTLNLRPNTDCFKRPVEQQYSCLTQTGSQSLLDDGHGQSIVNSLTSGASSDLITAASSTSLAGGGVYSAYVGAIVDVVRIMSNLHTAHYQYIPAIAFPQNEALNLRLNTPPSFENPKSVIVIGLPAIQKATPPPLRASNAHEVTCLLKPHVALPVEGAPLVFSTDLSHDLALHRSEPAGAPDLPLTPDAFQGGLVVEPPSPNHRTELNDKGEPVKSPGIAAPPPPAREPSTSPPADPSGASAQKTSGPSATPDPATLPPQEQPASPGIEHPATVDGYWGFDHFQGPTLSVQDAPGSDWKLTGSNDHIIAGEQNHLVLSSNGTACIESISAQEGSAPEQVLQWKQADKPNTVNLDLALHSSNAGAVRLLVKQYGKSDPDAISIQAYTKPADLKSLEYHLGDKAITLTGSNLAEVRQAEFGGLTFTRPDTPSTDNVLGSETPGQDDSTLRLNLAAGGTPAKIRRGEQVVSRITLTDGRKLTLPFVVAGPRPGLTILSRKATLSDSAQKIQLQNQDDLPLGSTLLLSLRAAAPFPRDAQIEISNQDNSLHDKLTLGDASLLMQDRTTVLAQIDLQKTFGSSAFGPLQIRLVLHDGTAGDWQPLGTLVRLPQLTSLTCTGTGDLNCALVGSQLFLLSAVAGDQAFTKPVEVPDGFVGSTLMIGHPPTDTLYLKLRDDPNSIATIVLPAQSH